jgi:cytochrome c
MRTTRLPLTLCLILSAGAAFGETRLDEQMKALASKSGCFSCHHIESGAKGPNGTAPIGPNWEDVALRYKGQPDPTAALVKTVIDGSNFYSSHWKTKVSGVAMPPNKVAISQTDAQNLVHWILNLK